jgi:ribonucleoside-diphosphate reductase alpha chain
MKRRGGVGFDISFLRPAGAIVNNSAKSSTGAASFMQLFSHVTNTIAQNGRRGALMLSILIKHPDALFFIMMKQDLSQVTGANVSV